VNDVDQTRGPSSLRGPGAQHISERFWFAAGALLLGVVAVVVVVSFISGTNDNARIERLKTHGVAVVVTVTSCAGNLGGSGSNASSYTCRGSYRVDGARYVEVIGSKSTLSPTGSSVRGVADPSRPSTVELASAVKRSSTSDSVYVVPSVLALLVLVLAALFYRRLTNVRSRR
jgi:hypothetical protein